MGAGYWTPVLRKGNKSSAQLLTHHLSSSEASLLTVESPRWLLPIGGWLFLQGETGTAAPSSQALQSLGSCVSQRRQERLANLTDLALVSLS